MNNERKFEVLKKDTIRNYENYIKAIKSFSYRDLHDLNKRLALLNSYDRAVLSHCKYKSFLNAEIWEFRKKPLNMYPYRKNLN